MSRNGYFLLVIIQEQQQFTVCGCQEEMKDTELLKKNSPFKFWLLCKLSIVFYVCTVAVFNYETLSVRISVLAVGLKYQQFD